MLYGFIKYDDFGTIGSIQSSTSKRKIIPIIFYHINKTTIGYLIGRGAFLLLAIYGFRRLLLKFKNKSKSQ
tara:strand:+ start:1360 stop:1572 length:213 start_codon:yes stop_codon:yes gene_type:complete